MKRQNLKQPIAIMALNTEHDTAYETACIRRAVRYDAGIKTLCGCYAGQGEFSYLVTLPEDQDKRSKAISCLTKLGKDHDQATILVSDEYRDTWLVSCQYPVHWLPTGKLKQVSKTEAKTRDGYTYDPETRSYWVTV